MDKRIGIMIPIEDMDDVIYAAREAVVRWKRARTEMRKGNDSYNHLNEGYVDEKLTYWTAHEAKMIRLYEDVTGEAW